MAPSRLASSKFEGEIIIKTNAIEEIVKESKVLDKKIEVLVKKRVENDLKVFGMIADIKLIRIADYEAEVSGEEGGDDEEFRALVICEGSNVVTVDDSSENYQEADSVSLNDLKEEQEFLRKKIKESTCNLGDHEKLLKSMERHDGRDACWHTQAADVMRFNVIHKTYKDAKEKRIEAISKELKRRELVKRKVVKEKFVFTQEASTSSGASACSSTLKSRFVQKRKLNESVIDCEEIMKKVPAKEKDAMVPKVLKVEEEASDQTYDCGFAHCRRGSFSSAAALMARA